VDEIPVSELTNIQELNSLETWEGNSGPQVLDLQVFWTKDNGGTVAVSDGARSAKHWCLGFLILASPMEASLC
jgi:hypothetical protein